MDDVFAVVVTWNGAGCIARCLRSLMQSTRPAKVVVVDNASTDSTLDTTGRVCPGATVFPLGRNLGFGRANNIGIKHAYDEGARNVVLINQDAYVEPDVVEGLVDLQRSHPAFGVLSPLHLDGTGRELDRRFCDHLATGSSMRRLLSDALLGGTPPRIYETEFINAAVWMLSRSCIETVGLFNPAFDHYGEDREYADRVGFHGQRIGLVPGLRAYHARAQEEAEEGRTLEPHLTSEKAIIRYRLSRMSHSAAFNVLSALSRVLLAECPGDTRVCQRARARIALTAYLLGSLVPVLGRRRTAYQGGRCFFSDAEADRTVARREKMGGQSTVSSSLGPGAR